jgi:hypothetical protein
MHYVVIEGRAKLLEGVTLHDPSTYGVEWIALEARSAGDAVQQWELFKTGAHPHQSAMETEVSGHRTTAPAVEGNPESAGRRRSRGGKRPGRRETRRGAVRPRAA